VAERKKITDAASMQPAVSIDDDFDGWLLDQASALRERRYFSLNWDRLAEELEDMAVLRREALRNDLTVVLEHMLKLAYEARPTQRQWAERQWKLHLAEHRDRVNDLLHNSGTLRAEFESLKLQAYDRARKRAGLAIDPKLAPIGPEECPCSTDQILDEDFFPSLQTS
jgi:Domain of unknown function DUF29